MSFQSSFLQNLLEPLPDRGLGQMTSIRVGKDQIREFTHIPGGTGNFLLMELVLFMIPQDGNAAFLEGIAPLSFIGRNYQN